MKTCFRLALLITGDIEAADQSIRNAQEIATHNARPLTLRGQLTEWVKWVTIKSAIACSRHEIAPCAPNYFNQSCTHSEHLLNSSDSKLQEFSNGAHPCRHETDHDRPGALTLSGHAAGRVERQPHATQGSYGRSDLAMRMRQLN